MSAPAPPSVDGTRLDALRTALGIDPPAAAEPAAVPPTAEPTALPARLKGAVRTRVGPLARRAARPALPVLRRAFDLVADRAVTRFAATWDELQAAYERQRVEAELVRGEVRALEALVLVDGGGPAPATAAGRLREVATNLELLKGDLRALGTRLEDLGQAIAPAAGLPGVPERFAELRDRVNAVDRRLRSVEATPRPVAPVDGGSAPSVAVPPAGPPGAGRFDYVGFERRFRGDPEVILATLAGRYLELLGANAPVLDVGCGRGELLSALADRGVACSGVDLDAGMVAEARAAGLDVVEGDAIAHLRSMPEGSLGSIIAVHVVEHLALDDLLELLELAASRLRPGGVLVAETPNPASLLVLGNSFILDPTHVWPLHPSLLTFLCERAGFREVELRFHAPAEDYHLPRLEVPEHAAWAEPVNELVERLNDVLFGAQEYAAVARTPPAPSPLEG